MANRRVLVCAAHPDDEALGCGGTMARHGQWGDEVHVMFLADGVASRSGDGRDVDAELDERRAAANAAATILGANAPIFVAYPDQRLDAIPLLDVTQSIERVMGELKPDIVYTHHAGDLNGDHRIVAQAVLTASRPFPGQPVAAIYGFEVLSSTEWAFGAQEAFRPSRFVSISGTLPQKLRALEAYRAEMRDYPHPRSLEAVEALARYRGATVGEQAAEAFTVFRECVR